jgi:hypothetical protein
LKKHLPTPLPATGKQKQKDALEQTLHATNQKNIISESENRSNHKGQCRRSLEFFSPKDMLKIELLKVSATLTLWTAKFST